MRSGLPRWPRIARSKGAFVEHRHGVRFASWLPPVAGRVSSTDQRSAHPALVRLADDPRLGPENPTGERVVAALLGLRVDIDPSDADRRRPEKAQPPGRLLVGHVHELDPRLDPQFAAEPLA